MGLILRRLSSVPLLSCAIALSLALVGCGATGSAGGHAAPNDVDASVRFSHESGAYSEDSIELVLDNPSGLELLYTTDGSLPTSDSNRYSGAITLDPGDTNRAFVERLAQEIPGERTILVDDSLPTATVIRAAAVLPDGSIGPVFTNTYFVGEDLGDLFGDVAVISIVADPFDLLDYETGIMATGAIYDEHLEENERLDYSNQQLMQANFTQRGKDWERAANLELFDRSNSLSYEAPCGIRLRGHFSAGFAQKSFNVYFRDSYGLGTMEYALLEDAPCYGSDEPVATFESFCLRSGGNSTETARFKDSFLQAQAVGYDMATQATRPAILFLNGEFYGVYCLNEKYSGKYVESHYGVSGDNVVIVDDGEVDVGEDADQALYDELMSYAEADLSDPATWEEFCAVADVRSLADYYAFQLYIGNADCKEDSNSYLWRTRDQEPGSEYGDARWRWMAYDLDYSAGMYEHDVTKADHDSVADYLGSNPLFASAMCNPTFRSMVRERLVDLSEGAFEPSRANRELDAWWDAWSPWIELSNRRFDIDTGQAKWELETMRRFFTERPDYILAYFDEHALAYGDTSE